MTTEPQPLARSQASATPLARRPVAWISNGESFLAHLDWLTPGTKKYGHWSALCGVDFHGRGTDEQAKGKHRCGACQDIRDEHMRDEANYA